MTPTKLPIVVGVTGASGAAYAVRLLQCLTASQIDVHLVISPSGAAVIDQELGLDLGPTQDRIAKLFQYAWPGEPTRWPQPDPAQVERDLARVTLHNYRDYMTPIASGSFLTGGMILCPCSGATLSGVVHASSANLIHRAAEVHLKEHRKLILVPRETPLSVFQIENMHRAAQAGAVVMPAMPGWYHGVTSIVDLIDFVVARILDQLNVPHTLIRRWGDSANPSTGQASASMTEETR